MRRRSRSTISRTSSSRVHLTLPASWRRRRLRVPRGLVLHFADIGDRDRSSFDAVPVTAPRRTLGDCIEAHVEPRLVVRQSARLTSRAHLGNR